MLDLNLITSITTGDDEPEPDERGQWLVLAHSEAGRVLALSLNLN